MRILHLITSIDKGGAESQVINLAEMQKKEKFSVLVVYAKGEGYWKTYKKINFLNLRKSSNSLRLIYDVLNIIRIIKKFKPDIINVHLPYMEICLFFSLFFLKKNFKIVCTKHLDNHLFDKIGFNFLFLGNFITRMVAKKYDKIIAISNAVKKFYLKNKIIDNPKKIEVIYYGIKLKQKIKYKSSINLRKKYKISSKDFIIGTVSRLVPQKSLHHLINSFSIFKSKYKKNSKLIIVGKGYLKKNLINYSKELKIKKDIIWIDFIEDTVEFISQLNVFALSSKYEGLGLVLLEAISARTPIVATSVGAIPEIVKNNINGNLAPYGNTKKFAFLLNASRKKVFKKKYKNQLLSKFNDEIMFKKTTKVYRELHS